MTVGDPADESRRVALIPRAPRACFGDDVVSVLSRASGSNRSSSAWLLAVTALAACLQLPRLGAANRHCAHGVSVASHCWTSSGLLRSPEFAWQHSLRRSRRALRRIGHGCSPIPPPSKASLERRHAALDAVPGAKPLGRTRLEALNVLTAHTGSSLVPPLIPSSPSRERYVTLWPRSSPATPTAATRSTTSSSQKVGARLITDPWVLATKQAHRPRDVQCSHAA